MLATNQPVKPTIPENSRKPTPSNNQPELVQPKPSDQPPTNSQVETQFLQAPALNLATTNPSSLPSEQNLTTSTTINQPLKPNIRTTLIPQQKTWQKTKPRPKSVQTPVLKGSNKSNKQQAELKKKLSNRMMTWLSEHHGAYGRGEVQQEAHGTETDDTT